MRTKSRQRIVVCAAMLLASLLFGGVIAHAQNAGAISNVEITAAKAWAFPLNPSSDSHAPKPDPHKVVHVPGSARTYAPAQVNLFNPPDWFPQDHPPMPQVVAHGRESAWACGFCHLPNGQGRPENAGLAGLPSEYIIEQGQAFRGGERGASAPLTTQLMAKEAHNLTDADLKEAAVYFAKLKFKPLTRVIETTTVPKTQWKHFLLVPDPSGAREPIGQRIIETTTDTTRTELRDTRFGFVAYVPPGSIARGAVIAAKGVGAAAACESCHGATLQGVGVIPPLAGRSPTYIVRELILFRTGKRTNPQAAPMRTEASQLSVNDMIAVAAYAASRKP